MGASGWHPVGRAAVCLLEGALRHMAPVGEAVTQAKYQHRGFWDQPSAASSLFRTVLTVPRGAGPRLGPRPPPAKRCDQHLSRVLLVLPLEKLLMSLK